MVKTIDDLYPREIANMIKLDSNEIEARVGINLIKLIEMGLVKVVGVMDDKLLYQREEFEEVEIVQA